MASFIFLCDFATEQECLDRSLFGTNPGEAHRDHYSKIKAGDTLFLYNFDAGMMRGPFAALTPCQMNLEPSAWKKARRNFPWQVRVDPASAFKVPITANELSRMGLLTVTRIGLLPPSELTPEQLDGLLAAFRQKNPTG
jgi:hypothetical protein